MKETELKLMVDSQKSTREIAKITGIGQTTVRYWLNKYGLKTTPTYGKTQRVCKQCGEIDLKEMATRKGNNPRRICKKCLNKKMVDRMKRNKLESIVYKGGKCIRCGYNKCQGALEFHHRNVSEKDPKWRYSKGWSIERIKKEIDKCDLLCCLCHREKHAGLW